jgi:hypothetical protein
MAGMVNDAELREPVLGARTLRRGGGPEPKWYPLHVEARKLNDVSQ